MFLKVAFKSLGCNFMILVLRRDITENAKERACQTLREHGLNAQLAQTGSQTVVVVNDEVSDLPSHIFLQ